MYAGTYRMQSLNPHHRQPYLSHSHFIHTGATGWGLNENVCEAYLWLMSNYVEGDEIFLFGFSRGAYTARAIGGLIAHSETIEGKEIAQVVFYQVRIIFL